MFLFVKKFAMKTLLAVMLGTCSMFPGQIGAAEDDSQLKEISVVNSYLPEDISHHWAADKIYDLIHAEIIKGYVEKDGTVTVKPNKKITRAEFVSLLVNALGLKKDPEQDARDFSDIEPNQWFYQSVNIASSLGIVKGVTQTTFGPNRNITRGEIAAFITRAFAYTVAFDETKAKRFKDVSWSYWANREVAKASSVQIISGYPGGYFKPYEYSTRAEAMAMLSNALYSEENAVPSDKSLLDIVKASEEEEGRALQSLDIARLKEISAECYIGYYKATQELTAAVLRKLKEEGYNVTITREGTLNAKVIGKWNRIAVVEVDGVKYNVRASKEGQKDIVNTQVVKGDIMLKKNPKTGQWQAYTSDVPLLFTDNMLSAFGVNWN
jgi:hypothetical protein